MACVYQYDICAIVLGFRERRDAAALVWTGVLVQ
jgi:hypothetical protein